MQSCNVVLGWFLAKGAQRAFWQVTASIGQKPVEALAASFRHILNSLIEQKPPDGGSASSFKTA